MKTNLFPTLLLAALTLMLLQACQPTEAPITPTPEPESLKAQANWLSIPNDREAPSSPDMPHLSSFYDFGVAPDGTIWTGSSLIRDGKSASGIWFYRDGVWNYFQEFEDAYPNAFDEAIVQRFMFDSEGNMWFGLRNRIIKYDGSEFTEYDFPNRIDANWLKVHTIEDDGTVWAGASRFVGKLKDGKWQTWELPDAGYIWHYDMMVEEGKAWLGTSKGLFIITEESSEWLPEITVDKKVGQGDTYKINIVPGIAKDLDGTVYVATSNGLFTWFEGQWNRFGPENSILNNKFVWAAETDRDGKVYFGAYNGLFRVDKAGWTYLGPAFEGPCQDCEYGIVDMRTDAQNRKFVLLEERFYLIDEL